MAYNKAAQSTFAWMGLVFWSFQLAPQGTNYRRRSIEGVSMAMLYLWFGGNMFYGAYAVTKGLYVGLIIQPQLFALFTLVNILQVYCYGYKWKMARVAAVAALLCVVYTGLHVGMWKAEEHAIEIHQDKATTFLGVLPAILIAAGFFPQFYVSIKQRSVEMSNFFIALDILGGTFSTISLVFDHSFDYVASITYLVVVLLDVVLVLLKLYFYARGTQGAAVRTAGAGQLEADSAKVVYVTVDANAEQTASPVPP